MPPISPHDRENGAAATSPANVDTVAGKVARRGVGASRRPANGPRMISIGMAEPRIALALSNRAKSETPRRAVRSAVGMGSRLPGVCADFWGMR